MADDGQLTVGRYALGPRLGVGGMGEVYLATQLGLGGFKKVVTLKLLLPHLGTDSEAVRMFLDEGRLAARMKHPGIVEIYDIAQAEGRYFLAMEFVDGASLDQVIRALAKAGRPTPPAVLLHVARALCEALHHAHELKGDAGQPLHLVHRDVTPHNVLVSRTGTVKLTDFGIAKVSDSHATTRTGTVKGKFDSMAPEQFGDGPVDRRADIYAAGLTLYRLATQTSPYRRDSDAATMRAVLQGERPRLQTLPLALPPEFVAAVERALSPNPKDRFATAAEFRDAIPEAPEGEAQLGEIVTTLCARDLSSLAEKVEATVNARGSSLNRETEIETTGRFDRRPWLWVGGGLVLAAAIAAVVVLRPDPPSPTIELALPRSSPEPTPPPPPVEAPPPTEPVEATAEHPTEPAVAPKPARTDARPPRKGTAQRVGYLSVDATPWAEVFVDGKRVGETPLDKWPVAEGSRLVVLSHPRNPRGFTRRVTISAGKTEFIRADLR